MKSLLHQVLEARASEVSTAIEFPKETAKRIRRGRRLLSFSVVVGLIMSGIVSVALVSQLRTHDEISTLTGAPALHYRGTIDLRPAGASAIGPFVYSVTSNDREFFINRGTDVVRFDPLTSRLSPLHMAPSLRLPSFSTAIEDIAANQRGLWILHSTLRGSNQRLALSRVELDGSQAQESILLPRTLLTRGHADRQIVVNDTKNDVWAVNGGLGYGEAILINSATNRIVRSLPIGSITGASLAVDSSGAWFGTHRGIIHLSIGGIALGVVKGTGDAYQIATDGQNLWATTGEDGNVLQIDGVTNQIKTRTHLTWPSALAIGDGAVWVLEDSRTIDRLDAKTGSVTGRYDVPGGVRGPASMTLANGFLVLTSMNDARVLWFSVN